MSIIISRIPVYRLSLKKFNDETENIVQSSLSSLTFESEEKKNLWLKKQRDLFSYYKPHYNEIIGWIEVEILCKEIIINVWKREAKRLLRNPKQNFYCAHFRYLHLNCNMCKNELSEDIFRELINYISIAQEDCFKSRYMDLRDFYQIGEYINWTKLIEDIVLGKIIQPAADDKY